MVNTPCSPRRCMLGSWPWPIRRLTMPGSMPSKPSTSIFLVSGLPAAKFMNGAAASTAPLLFIKSLRFIFPRFLRSTKTHNNIPIHSIFQPRPAFPGEIPGLLCAAAFVYYLTCAIFSPRSSCSAWPPCSWSTAGGVNPFIFPAAGAAGFRAVPGPVLSSRNTGRPTPAWRWPWSCSWAAPSCGPKDAFEAERDLRFPPDRYLTLSGVLAGLPRDRQRALGAAAARRQRRLAGAQGGAPR